MKKLFFFAIACSIIFTLCSERCLAVPIPEQLLKAGLTFFKRGDYEEALARFRSLKGLGKDNPYGDAVLYLEAKTLIRMQRYDEAEEVIRNFFSQYLQSRYYQYVKYLLAEVYYAKGYERNCILWLLELVSGETDSDLRKLAESKLEFLIEKKSPGELDYYREQTSSAGRYFLDKTAKKFFAKGTIFLLISSGDSAGLELAGGMRKALELYQMKTGTASPALEIVDAGQNSFEAVMAVKKLSENEEVKIIVSALSGEQSIAAAAASNCLSQPFCAVFDDTPDLWKIGNNIWQLSPDKVTMGRAFARFAVEILNCRRFAVLAPLDTPSRTLAEAFIQTADSLEVEMPACEWYYTESSDLGKYFENIRRVGFRCDFADSLKLLAEKDSLLLDSTYAIILPDSCCQLTEEGLYKIDSLYIEIEDLLWKKYQDTLKYKARFQRIKVDSNDIRLDCFDSFLFLFPPQNADMYIPQFAFYNFKTHFLCEASSFSVSSLAKYQQYFDNLTAVIWGQADRSSVEFITFNSEYLQVSDRAPSDNELLGLDVMNFILRLSHTPAGFGALGEDFSYDGVGWDFEFKAGAQSNQSIKFLYLEDDVLRPFIIEPR